MAESRAEKMEQAQERMREMEKLPAEELPKDPSDWPDDDSKYLTFGGPEGDHGYEEGPEAKLGSSDERKDAGA